jgi:equilibrative nucleoside transporter 1/2/3
MDDRSTLGRVRTYFTKSDSEEYEPVNTENDDEVRRPILVVPDDHFEDEEELEVEEPEGEPFSWLEYSIFLLLGVVMLWAW